jgi:glycosyltransferase involved in cell wall biosynthesis
MLVGRWLANSYAAANEIVAVSNNTADAMRQAIGRNVSTVHNWVDTEAFKPNESSLESKERSRFRILFVGNPSRWKGSDLIPEYAKRLGNSVEIWCLWGLRDKSVLSKLPRNVKSIPRVEMAKMPDLYRQVDSVIVPARYEAFGFVALEAMASGLPVVGFNTTGTAEVCVDGVTALLSNVDDVGSLVENTNRLIASSELRTSLGHAGRRRVVADFSEALAIERYLETYRRAIKNFNHR